MNRAWFKLLLGLVIIAPAVFLVVCVEVRAIETDASQASLVIESLKESNSLLWKLGTIIVGAETATIIFLMRNWIAEKAKLVEKIEAGNAQVVKILRERLGEKED